MSPEIFIVVAVLAAWVVIDFLNFRRERKGRRR
jgi:hypothetical protein